MTPKPYECTPDCEYRTRVSSQCFFGKKPIPHPKRDNALCLYQIARQRLDAEQDRKEEEEARARWTPKPEPPAEIPRTLIKNFKFVRI